MSGNWDDLVKEPSPGEELNKQKTEAEKNRYPEKLIPTKLTTWNYERKKIDQLFGWEIVGKVTEILGTRVVGEEFVKTSENTYERRDKVETLTEQHYKMRLDTTKICDQQKYNELYEQASEFLSQAEKKFGKNVVPAYFSGKESLRYLFPGFKMRYLFIAAAVCILIGGIAGVILSFLGPILYVGILHLNSYFHRKKYASYIPLVEAYQSKVKEFEEAVKKVTSFHKKTK